MSTLQLPAKVCWCDAEPESHEDYTVCHTAHSVEELDAALDRFEQDMRRLNFSLQGEIYDCEGDYLTFGFTDYQDMGFVAYQPKHLLHNDNGHFQRIPLKWSVASAAEAATLPPIGNRFEPRSDRIDFLIWPGYDPFEVKPQYCVPIALARQAIREYLTTGEFTKTIAWGERPDWTIAKV
jgi:Immunity protein Imm1